MTSLLQNATHDQIVLAICFGAVLISAAVMYFSFHVGQLTSRVRVHDTTRASELRANQIERAIHDRAA